MSIIHEALKKTQSNLKDLPTQATPRSTELKAPAASAPTPAPQASPKPIQHFADYTISGTRPAEQKTPAAQSEKTETAADRPIQTQLPLKQILIALVLLGLLLIARPFLNTLSPKTSPAPVPSAQTAPVKKGGGYFPVVSTASTTQYGAAANATPPLRPQLILNGISITGEKPLALINNEIYEIGEDVYGLRILNINESGVELMDDDQKIFLKRRK